MKNVLPLILAIITISCKTSSSESKENFDWIIGHWIRTNETEDKLTFENWGSRNLSEYDGFSFTLQNNDTIWLENVKLIKIDGSWSFNVIGMVETDATKFNVTEIEGERFICENQTIEFPKKIEYSRKGDSLFSIISGDDLQLKFDFKKIK